MLHLEAKVAGVKETSANLLAAGPSSREAIRTAFTGLGQDIRATAQAGAPVGATGKLRRRINFKIFEKADRLTLNVRPFQYYGLFIEGGVDKPDVTVRQHTRRNARHTKGGYTATAHGKRSTRVRFVETQTGITFVKQYHRSAHIKAHPFMHPAYEAVESAVVGRISDAIKQATSGR